MAAARWLAFGLFGLTITGCSEFLPKPEYSYVKTPAPIRALPDGTRVDNRGYYMDANGYRLDRNGRILGEVDYSTKADTGVSSNAVAGYFISSTGAVATGSVATPSEGARMGPSGGVDYAPVPASTSNTPRLLPTDPSAQPAPVATTAPVPLTPSR